MLEDRKSKTVAGVDWTYPSRGECLVCHASMAGQVLGLRPAQLNRTVVPPILSDRSSTDERPAWARGFMPRLGSHRIDHAGLALIRA